MKKVLTVACTVVALAFGLNAIAADKAAEKAPAPEKAATAEKAAKPAKEHKVTGTVEKKDAALEIKGKKTYTVDPASPKFADVEALMSKKVEAMGTVKDMTITVNKVKEVVAKKKAEKKAETKAEEKTETKAQEKAEEKK